LQQFISIDRHDYVNVNKIAHVGGLGGANKRDGSFAYYMSEPIVTNDHKGVGPFLLLTNEMKKRLNH
jgi:unsaturated rhamnogalacturonyl hydrolase